MGLGIIDRPRRQLSLQPRHRRPHWAGHGNGAADQGRLPRLSSPGQAMAL